MTGEVGGGATIGGKTEVRPRAVQPLVGRSTPMAMQERRRDASGQRPAVDALRGGVFSLVVSIEDQIAHGVLGRGIREGTKEFERAALAVDGIIAARGT